MMLTAAEARRLDRLAVSPAGTAPAATASGLRHARTRGAGIEFQDYRHYQPGDDLRSIDWTVEARLQQLVVRVTRGEGQLRLHLLLDVSGSMAIGTPSKLHAAAKVAAALCYIAIEHRDAVGIATFTDTVAARQAPASGRPQIFRVFEVLRAAQPGGRSNITRALKDYAGATRGGGLVVVLSDFFQPGGAVEGLRYALYHGLTPAVVQVVASEELLPVIPEEVELVEIEDPSGPPVVVDAAVIRTYQANVARASADLGEFCSRHGLPFLRVEASQPFDGLLDACVRSGLIGRLA
jgi:uncharacterized protein (DUF58 family)